MSRQRYSYQPRVGHGLPHDPLNAIIAPRPIGWISSQSAAGVRNRRPTASLTALTTIRRLSASPAGKKTACAIFWKPANSSGIW